MKMRMVTILNYNDNDNCNEQFQGTTVINDDNSNETADIICVKIFISFHFLNLILQSCEYFINTI